MTASMQDSEYYQLDNMYRMTPYTGQNCSMIMRDIDNKVRAVVNVCDNKISNVSGYKGERVSASGRRALIKFIKKHNYQLTLSAARDLGLTIYRPSIGGELYLDEKELVALLEQGDISGAALTVHHFKRREVRIKSATKGAILNFSRAEIKKIVIGKSCNLVVDLRDNPYIQTLVVKEGFAGTLNLSRCGLTDIQVSDNCRCDMRINDSMKCFDLMIGDVFSGSLNVKNSCFHDLDIGYYSYASINLETNWGRRRIKIGNSFRGDLFLSNVHVPDIKIGDDCKGRIRFSADKAGREDTQKIIIADEFNGDLNLSNSRTVTQVELGQKAGGKINMPGCSALKVARLGKQFNGTADFSRSSLEYLRAGEECNGKIILMNCDNLALLKMPGKHNSKIMIEKEPLDVKSSENDVYYQYDEKELPGKYFTPFYVDWYNNVKDFFREKLRN